MRLLKSIFLIFHFMVFTAIASAHDSIRVYVFLLESCQICQNQTAALNEIYNEFQSRGVEFIGVFPNTELSSQQGIDSFKTKFGIKFPLIFEPDQTITKACNASITPEVVVMNSNTNQVYYKGKIDNSYVRVGQRRSVTTEFYLMDALTHILANKPVLISEMPAVGCFIMHKSQ